MDRPMKPLRSRYFLRILIPVSILLIAAVLTVSWYITQGFTENSRKQSLLKLETLREAKVSMVVQYIHDRILHIHGLSHSPLVAESLKRLNDEYQHDGVASESYQHTAVEYNDYMHEFINVFNYDDLFLINMDGDIIYSVKHKSDFATNLISGPLKDSELARVFKHATFFLQTNSSTFAPYAPFNNKSAAFLATPVIEDNELFGVLALQINAFEVNRRITEISSMGTTGEIVAGKLDHQDVLITVPLRYDEHAAFNRRIPLNSSIAKPIILSSQGHTGSGIMDDWRGKSVIATWEYLPHLEWGVVNKMDISEAMASEANLLIRGTAFLIIALILACWLAFLIAQRVVVPISMLSELSRRFTAGDHTVRVNEPAPNNEIGVLMHDMNGMMEQVAQSEQASRSLLHQLEHHNKILDQRIIEKTASLAGVIKHAADGIITLNSSGLIEMVNPAACTIFKRSEHDLLQCRASDLFSRKNPCHDITSLVQYMPHKANKTTAQIELEGLRSDGESFPMELSLSDMQNEQMETGMPVFLLLIRDISEGKKMREQLEHTQRLESLGVLAGGIAHDFNNLLTTILGNAAMAKTRVSSLSPAGEMLNNIEAASEKAALLCRQMLAYSGKGRFVVRPLNLNELVNEMLNLLQVSIHKSTILRLELSEEALPAVKADAAQLQQVIMNLIINASESMGGHDGVVAVRTGMVHIEGDMFNAMQLNDEIHDGLYIFLEVSDTGCGMDPDTLKHLFDPFFTTKFTGRGLGMSATQGIVRGHGGAIKVYSEQGKGTTFKVFLPATKDDILHEEEVKKTKPNNDWQGEGCILIVDDEETIRATASMMLQSIGFKVFTANDGKQGVECYRQQQENITAVLLDMSMPVLNGEETYKLLRQINPEVKVILSSGYNEQEAVSFFAGKGLVGFIQKPYSLQTLRSKIQEYLS